MDNNWIKISDHAPVFPAWLWHPDHKFPLMFQCDIGIDCSAYTHWQPATIPAPPPKELTQAERDEEALLSWYRSRDLRPSSGESWHAALKWEREQIDDDFFEALFRWRDNDRDTREQDEFIRDFFRARREGGNK